MSGDFAGHTGSDLSRQPIVALITGATGAVGLSLAEELVAQGYRVRALLRRPRDRSLLPASVEIYPGDITDGRAVAEAVTGADVVFHLAARLHISNPTEDMRAEYERVNVEGTRTVVAAAQSAGVQRLVFFSTISVYGPTGREPLCEAAPTYPDSIYAQTKLRAEQICLEATNSSGCPLAVVLRMAAVYGPRMKGNYATLVKALAKGRFALVGRGTNLRTLVYYRDAVEAAILASRHAKAAGGVYNVADGATHTLVKIVATICESLGRRPPTVFIPLWFARSAATAADWLLVAARRRRFLQSAIDKMTETVSVQSDRIQRELGFRPRYDLPRGWEETVIALRQEGGLR